MQGHDLSTWLNEGLQHYAAGEPARALEAWYRVLEHDPKHVAALEYVAFVRQTFRLEDGSEAPNGAATTGFAAAAPVGSAAVSPVSPVSEVSVEDDELAMPPPNVASPAPVPRTATPMAAPASQTAPPSHAAASTARLDVASLMHLASGGNIPAPAAAPEAVPLSQDASTTKRIDTQALAQVDPTRTPGPSTPSQSMTAELSKSTSKILAFSWGDEVDGDAAAAGPGPAPPGPLTPPPAPASTATGPVSTSPAPAPPSPLAPTPPPPSPSPTPSPDSTTKAPARLGTTPITLEPIEPDPPSADTATETATQTETATATPLMAASAPTVSVFAAPPAATPAVPSPASVSPSLEMSLPEPPPPEPAPSATPTDPTPSARPMSPPGGAGGLVEGQVRSTVRFDEPFRHSIPPTSTPAATMGTPRAPTPLPSAGTPTPWAGLGALSTPSSSSSSSSSASTGPATSQELASATANAPSPWDETDGPATTVDLDHQGPSNPSPFDDVLSAASKAQPASEPVDPFADLPEAESVERTPSRVPSAPRPPVVAEPDENALEQLMTGARELFELGDFSGSLELVEKVLAQDPAHEGARAYLRRNESTLLGMYESKLGSLQAVPRQLVPPDEVIWMNMHHRAGFILSQIDGTLTYEDVLDISGMDRFDTMRILADLVTQGIIG